MEVVEDGNVWELLPTLKTEVATFVTVVAVVGAKLASSEVDAIKITGVGASVEAAVATGLFDV